MNGKGRTYQTRGPGNRQYHVMEGYIIPTPGLKREPLIALGTLSSRGSIGHAGVNGNDREQIDLIY